MGIGIPLFSQIPAIPVVVGAEEDGEGDNAAEEPDTVLQRELNVALGRKDDTPLAVPCVWFNIEFCAAFAMQEGMTVKEVRKEVFFVGKCVGYDTKEKRNLVMVPDDAFVYKMGGIAFRTYTKLWKEHGEQRTVGYYRWKEGAARVVEAEDMNNASGFEKPGDVMDACDECGEMEGVRRCKVCEENMFCEEHGCEDNTVCGKCLCEGEDGE